MDCAICKTAKAIFKKSSAKGVAVSKNSSAKGVAVSKNSSAKGVAICYPCYWEFKRMMNLMNKNNISGSTRYSANWGTDSANRWIEEVKQVKEEMKKRVESWIDYLGGLASAFKEESYSDIQVKPGNGPSIPAHKFLLATRSEIFKNMLLADTCKAAPIDSICLPEFNYEELATFLELLYCGNLAKEKFEMHYYCLALASHKYAIPYLQKFCEENILKILDSSNTLKVLEIAEICSNETLKVAALESISYHKKEITDSPSFLEFVIQNPHLMPSILDYAFTRDQSKKTKKMSGLLVFGSTDSNSYMLEARSCWS